jgi:hypothetical protein
LISNNGYKVTKVDVFLVNDIVTSTPICAFNFFPENKEVIVGFNDTKVFV